jgi:hypothetical protein
MNWKPFPVIIFLCSSTAMSESVLPTQGACPHVQTCQGFIFVCEIPNQKFVSEDVETTKSVFDFFGSLKLRDGITTS